MGADELMRRLISGELTNYRVVRTSPEPLQKCIDKKVMVHTASSLQCNPLKGYVRKRVIRPKVPNKPLAITNVQ
jgi:hypothetical protein